MKPTKEKPIVQLASRIAYENKWLRVREDQTLRAKGEGIYAVVETQDSVVVCAIDESQRVYLVYGYSYPTDTWSWQVPGGGGDGENPCVAAARELEEETGLKAEKYQVLGNLTVSNGLLNEQMAVVVATGLRKSTRLASADDSDVVGTGKFVHYTELASKINSGEICDSQSISAIYFLEKWITTHGN